MNTAINQVAFACTEFLSNDGPVKAPMVVVGPIRLVEKSENEEAVVIVFNGCSWYKTCLNPNCTYSSYALQDRRERKRGQRAAGIHRS